MVHKNNLIRVEEHFRTELFECAQKNKPVIVVDSIADSDSAVVEGVVDSRAVAADLVAVVVGRQLLEGREEVRLVVADCNLP